MPRESRAGLGSLLLAGLLLAGCGAKSALELPDVPEDETSVRDDAGTDDARTDDGAIDDGGFEADAAGCDLPPAAECRGPLMLGHTLIGEDTVVQDVEVLDTGHVLVAGYFGLIRREPDGDDWVSLAAPEVVSSSFVQLEHAGEAVWAAAFGEVVHSPDGGGTWEAVPGFDGADQVHHLPGVGTFLGADDLLGVATGPTGTATWHEIEALDGDSGTYWENNTVLGLVLADGWYVATERFGRVARARDPAGAWEAVDHRLPENPELLDVGEGRILALGSGGAVELSCDAGATWIPIGAAGRYPAVGVMATQLARAVDGRIVAAGSDGPQVSCDLGQTWRTIPPPVEHTTTYDVSAAPDGSVWAAGFQHVYRVFW